MNSINLFLIYVGVSLIPALYAVVFGVVQELGLWDFSESHESILIWILKIDSLIAFICLTAFLIYLVTRL